MAQTLTRHFYALDEVLAALAHSCIASRPKEACFWLQELIDSGEAAFAIKAMVEAYILNCGVQRLGWLKAAYEAFASEEVTEDALYELCIALCRISVRDYSLIGLHLVRFSDCQAGRIPKLTCPPPEGVQAYFIEALRQGNVRAAFWAAGSLDSNSLLTILRSGAHPLMVGPLEIIYRLNSWAGTTFAPHTILCLLLMTCGLRADEFEATLKPPTQGIPATVLEERIQWTALLGRRARRLYAIPHGCFYLVTRRGRMPWSESTDADIRRVGDQLTTAPYLRNCEFWNNMIDECSEGFADDEGWDDKGWDDEGWENFSNKAFVDDIPDEWSLEERQKSHGPGKCGQATACATVSKWLRYNVSTTDMGAVTFRESRFLTGCEEVAKQAINLIGAERYVPVAEDWSASGWLATLWLQANTEALDASMMNLTKGLATISTGS